MTCFTTTRFPSHAGAADNSLSVYTPLSCGLSSARIIFRCAGFGGEMSVAAFCITCTNARISGISRSNLVNSSSDTSSRASLANAWTSIISLLLIALSYEEILIPPARQHPAFLLFHISNQLAPLLQQRKFVSKRSPTPFHREYAPSSPHPHATYF